MTDDDKLSEMMNEGAFGMSGGRLDWELGPDLVKRLVPVKDKARTARFRARLGLPAIEDSPADPATAPEPR